MWTDTCASDSPFEETERKKEKKRGGEWREGDASCSIIATVNSDPVNTGVVVVAIIGVELETNKVISWRLKYLLIKQNQEWIALLLS